MYDPNQDAQEKLKKLALEKLLINNAAETAPIAVQPPTAASIELNVPAPDVPPTFFEQMQPYLQQVGQGAADYSGQGFGNPNIPAVQRGGGMLTPAQMPMSDYGDGLNSSGILDSIIKQQHGGVSSFVDDNADALKELREKIARAMTGGA
jgi:hypothetical protein